MTRSEKSGAKKSSARKATAVLRAATVKKATKDRAPLVHMNSQGRLTLPASARRSLGLEGEVDFQLDLDSHALILKPAVVMTLEDAWAYTVEHRNLLARAHADSRRGRVQTLTEGQLDRIAAAR